MASAGHAAPAFLSLAAHPLRWRLLTALAGGDYRVRELTTLVEQPQNLVSYHLRLLREAGLVSTVRSSFDGRDSYYRVHLDRCADGLAAAGAALHPALQPEAVLPAGGAVLFACSGNSARSPIAEALLRHHSHGRVAVTSAGSRPKPHVHPAAVRLLRERFGIDIAGQRPRDLRSLTEHRFDYVITLCDKVREVCPEFPGPPRRAHWSVAEPIAADEQSFDRTLSEIEARIRYLLPVLAANQEEVSS
ncbi:ArsR family transcriptional regulator [Micromonospora sp. CPCC 205371]|nr:ArsR family transcriptional regulator [Micromonospora sp. CPCC 205371]